MWQAAVAQGAGELANAGVNAYNAWADRKAQREEWNKTKKSRENAANEALYTSQAGYDDSLNKLNEWNANRIRLANPQMAKSYMDLINNYNPDVYSFDKFENEYDKTVEDFINPEANKIAEMAGLRTQADLASQGAAKGSGALANMGYSRWEAARDLYNDAQNQLLADRAQRYNEYGDYIDRMQNKLNLMSQNQLQKANLLGGAVQNEQTQQSDYMSSLMNLIGDRTQTQVNANLAKAM